jgi:hypothetical protein
LIQADGSISALRKNSSDSWGRPSRTLFAGNEKSINAKTYETRDDAVQTPRGKLEVLFREK